MPPKKRRTTTKKATASEASTSEVTTTLLYDPTLDTPDGGHQPPLDGMPPFSPKVGRVVKRKPVDTNVIRWARYKVQKPEKCDTCLIEVAAQWGTVPTSAPHLACYRRTQHGVAEYLCWIHTEERRRKDGLPAFKAGGR